MHTLFKCSIRIEIPNTNVVDVVYIDESENA